MLLGIRSPAPILQRANEAQHQRVICPRSHSCIVRSGGGAQCLRGPSCWEQGGGEKIPLTTFCTRNSSPTFPLCSMGSIAYELPPVPPPYPLPPPQLLSYSVHLTLLWFKIQESPVECDSAQARLPGPGGALWK